MSAYWADVGNGLVLLSSPGAKVVLCAGRDGRLKTCGADGLLVDLCYRDSIAERIMQAFADPGESKQEGE